VVHTIFALDQIGIAPPAGPITMPAKLGRGLTMGGQGFSGDIRKVVMGHDIWETFADPTPIPPSEHDPSDRPLDFRMPENGTRLRIAEFPPANSAEPFMHRTESVDIVMVLRGEMTMLVEGGEDIVLRAGDTLVQRATIHAWVNRGPEPCRVMFLMIGGRLTDELKAILGVEKLEWDASGHSQSS
jgi:quercetin dioxygenase-like cupin family protein